MKNNQIVFPFFFMLMLSGFANAQENLPDSIHTIRPDENMQPKTDWTKKIFAGGGLTLQFGTYTAVGISPIVGYRFTENFSGGVGATYIYYNDKANNLSTNIYGGKVFGEYNVYKGLAPYAEFEVLSLEVFDSDPTNLSHLKRVEVSSLLIGASYTQEIGENSGMYIMLLYNVLDNIYSPYENPVLRIGFNVGF